MLECSNENLKFHKIQIISLVRCSGINENIFFRIPVLQKRSTMITTLKLISFFTLGVVLIEISVFNPQRQRVLVYRRSLKSLESAGEDVVRSQYLAEDDSRNDKKSRCQIWRTSKEILNKNLKTKIISNNEKFIIPILYNGPNNQLMGVRQAAYVSVILNRTLVLPTFRKHLTEDGGNLTEVDANQR